MPIQKMLNILKILFAALSAMFLFLYLSLMQRQANAVTEVLSKNVRDADSLLNQVPLSPAMALIPMIVCIIFTIFLFVIGAKEKKKLEGSAASQQSDDKAEGTDEKITEETFDDQPKDLTQAAPTENSSDHYEQN